MSRAINHGGPIALDVELSVSEKIKGMWPVLASICLAAVFIFARLYAGPRGFLHEGDLTVLALVCYISAAVLFVTNLFVKERVLSVMGLVTLALGISFNFSGWMIRWIEAGDAEGWKEGINGVWRYFPLDNLYPLTLGFCFGAAITTLVIIRKPKHEFLAALSMPIVVVILTLAMLMGNHISTLPPILDSYWRPIHVSVATIGYGVCLVSFGLALAYLIKDGVRLEAIAMGVALFGLLVYASVGRFGVLQADYGASLFMGKSALPVRASLPVVGPLMAATMAMIAGALLLFTFDWFRRSDKDRKWAWRLMRGAVVLQAAVVVVLFYQIKTVDNPASRISETEMAGFSQWMMEQNQMSLPTAQGLEMTRSWIEDNGGELALSLKSNPVETAGLIGLLVALALVSLFAWRREDVARAMPSITAIDALLYRTVGVAFPLLTLLLITGAVWANESWGRYWGWDPKETGALVAWMAYAGFLHTRISHGWRGRKSAYFALLGFALVIFTWLGVSYLLPGLHSYA